MAYVVASCLVDVHLRLNTFTDATRLTAAVLDLAARITAEETLPARSADGLVFQAEITVHTRTGTTTSRRCEAPRGHTHRPASASEVLAKFADCVTFGRTRHPVALGE